jgi:hypothetical protein
MRNSDFTRMCSTVDRLAFAARCTRSEVNMEGLMPTRIGHHDKISALTQPPDIRMVTTETMHFLQVSYTAIDTVLGVLQG